jgi:autotransporter-associated beta strand protein
MKKMSIKMKLIVTVLVAAASIQAQTTNVWIGDFPLSTKDYNTIGDNTQLSANWLSGSGANDNDTGHYVFDSANLADASRTRIRENRFNVTRLSMLFAMDNPVFNDPANGGDGTVNGFTLMNEPFTLAGNVAVNSGEHTIANTAVTQTVNTAWSVASGASITVSGSLVGNYGVTKTGGGALLLGAENAFTGGLAVNGGTVAFSSDNNLGAATAGVSIAGGTLKANSSNLTTEREFAVGAGGATFQIDEGKWSNRGATGVSYAFTGTGDIIKTGAGTLYVNNPDSRTAGNIIVEEGTFEFSFANRIRNGSTVTLHAGSTLENSLPNAGTVSLEGNDIILDGGTATLKNSGLRDITVGAISGDAALLVDVTDAGSFELLGQGTYSGGTTLAAGKLIANAENAFGTGGMTVADGAELILKRNDTIDDAATLILGTSSAFAMDFTGEERIAALSLDNGATFVNFGTYDASALTGLGDGTYTGTGVLNVAAAGSTGYDVWADSYSLTGGKTDDDDNDGLLNVYEYGLGGNPTNAADRGILPVYDLVKIDETNSFSYIHPQLKDENSGVSYKLALTTDLVNVPWTTNSGYVVLGTNVPASGDFDYVTNVTSTVDDSKFIRLVIE